MWLPDVLVSDIGMPEDDGYELVRKVRALDTERGGNVPALALTAFSTAPKTASGLSRQASTGIYASQPIRST